MIPASFSDAQRLRSLAAVIASSFAIGVSLGVTFPLFALLLERQGIDTAVIGLHAAMSPLAALLIGPFSGRLIRRLGGAGALFGGLLLSLAALLLMPVLTDLAAWFVLRFLMGAGIVLPWVVGETWINVLASEERRGRVMGCYGAAFFGGLACGPLLLDAAGIQGWPPFIAAGLTFALAALPLLAARHLIPTIASSPELRMLMLIRRMPMIFAAGLIAGYTEASIYSLLPLYGLRSGLGQQGAVIMLSWFVAGAVALQLPLGWIADRLDRHRVLLSCTAVAIACTAIFPFVIDTAVLVWPLLLIWGGAVLGFYTLGLVLLGQRFPAHEISAANAAFIVAYELGSLSGPVVGGLAMDLWNPHGLLVAVLLACTAFLATGRVTRRSIRRIGARLPRRG